MKVTAEASGSSSQPTVTVLSSVTELVAIGMGVESAARTGIRIIRF